MKTSKPARYFCGLGVGLVIISLYAYISAGQIWASYDDFQKELHREMNNAMVMAGHIILIVSLIMFGLASVLLIIFLKGKKTKQIKRESQPVRKKTCPDCGTDITNLTICPNCGHLLKTI